MTRPNLTRVSRTLERHSIRPPRRTALVWCKRCSRRHAGHCELVQVPARNREGQPVSVPHFGHTPPRRRRRRED